MKFSSAIVCLLSAGSAAAFAPACSRSAPSPNSALSAATLENTATGSALDEERARFEKMMQSQEIEQVVKPEATSDRIQPGRYNDKAESIAIPFLKRPSKLDGSLAGDVGFDPLGLSEWNDLYVMQEAELRHARLAMLAVAGWPMSELFAPDWMLRSSTHMAPSVLNGFNPLSFLATAAIFAGFGYFEYQTSLRRVDNTPIGKKHAEDMADIWKYGVPGDYNFDPLGLYSMFGDTAAGRKGIRELEIAHGRAAMLGITSFAVWEKLTGHPIVENSMFFHPNALLPALAVAYLAFPFFFEVESDEQYLFQVRTSSEGEMRMESIKNGVSKLITNNESTIEDTKKLSIALAEGAMDLGNKYDAMKDAYTKSVMQYANKD